MPKKIFCTHLIVTLALISITSLFFWLKSDVDIAASQFFYTHNMFALHDIALFRHMPKIINWLLIATSLALTIGLMLSSTLKHFHSYRRNIRFLLLCFILGPGLLVNGVLKTYWGRPRPQNISYFKGQHDYQKVWMVSNACDHNCSFVCGDCAAMFCFVAFAFIAKRKKLIATIAVLQASFFSFLRLGLGKHFLSDILLAWLLVYLVILLVYYLTFLRPSSYKTK